jgi:hypothetical protein
MFTRKSREQHAHYVCGACGRLFQTLLKLYGHEKVCKGRKSELPLVSREPAGEDRPPAAIDSLAPA